MNKLYLVLRQYLYYITGIQEVLVGIKVDSTSRSLKIRVNPRDSRFVCCLSHHSKCYFFKAKYCYWIYWEFDSVNQLKCIEYLTFFFCNARRETFIAKKASDLIIFLRKFSSHYVALYINNEVNSVIFNVKPV